MMDPITQHESSSCSLNDPKVSAVLERLHQRAKEEKFHYAKIGLDMLLDRLFGRKPTVAQWGQRAKDLYIPLSRETGTFAYLVARSIRARRIVEFGTSFGISTIYFAAAVRDNGGGLVIGSEIEETKVAKAQEHLEEAGLKDYVDIRVGDAQRTLADPGGVVDMALMDGLNVLYLPIIKMLTPHLRPGAVVLADDINLIGHKKALAPYVAFMQDAKNGFQSVTLPVQDGIEYSVRLAD